MANKHTNVKAFILRELRGGEMSLKRLSARAEAQSIPHRTLRRIAYSMGVKRKTSGFGPTKKSMWSLDPALAQEQLELTRAHRQWIDRAYRFELAAKTDLEKAFWYKVRRALRKVEV